VITLLIIAYESTYKTFSTQNIPTDGIFSHIGTVSRI